MQESVISCIDLEAGYQNNTVLKDIKLEIPKGTFIPFVGANGAGKTTLFRTMLGLQKPLAGHVQTPFKTKAPGYVPQFRVIDSFYPVTARQIVNMGLYPKLNFWKASNKKNKHLVDSLLTKLALLEHAEKHFSELSGGMKQKAFIARALVSQPDIILMDEPTSELDARSHHEIMTFLREQVENHHITVLFAIHGLRAVDYPWEQVCLLHKDKVELLRRDEYIEKHGSVW